jgi:hypothetical protein
MAGQVTGCSKRAAPKLVEGSELGDFVRSVALLRDRFVV